MSIPNLKQISPFVPKL